MHKASFRFSTSVANRTMGSWSNVRSTTTMAAKLTKVGKKSLSCDDNTGHIHSFKLQCVDQECVSKKCPSLCNQVSAIDAKGYYTHRPIAGKYCRFLHDSDAHGEPKAHYYVKNTDKTKTVSGQQAQDTHAKDLKYHSKMKDHIQNNKLESKIDE